MSKIEWVKGDDGKEGKTWNPVTGCSKISPGCKNCFAERMAKRLAGRFGYPKGSPFAVTYRRDKIDQPSRWRKPGRVFVCSMGDLFHPSVKIGWLDRIYAQMALNGRHTFMLLTKRPQRALDYFAGVASLLENPHIWIGVTAENQQMANERIPILLQIPAAVRFVSVEPMLEPVIFKRGAGDWLEDGAQKAVTVGMSGHGERWPTLNWVICGAETGSGKRPMDADWARSLRDQCQAAGVPFFFKRDSQGSRMLDGRMWEERPNV